MKNFKLKIISFVLIFAISAGVVGQISPVKTANAIGLPVIDFTAIGNWLWDFSTKVVLQTLKKRLLAIMTDNVVEWINNGYGKEGPKFTQDFIKVLTDAGDQAVGDVLQQYAATKVLCQPFDFDITFQLQQPAPLAERAQCTLTSVIKSFESYRDDFKNGGWIGYQELLKPQNNQWGVELLTQSEITSRTALKINSSLLKETVSIGFDSSECTGGWDLVELGTKKPADPDFVDLDPYRHIAKGSTYAGKTWDDPKVPPPSPIIGGVQTTGLEYVCAGAMVTTPGRTLAAGLEKSVWKDFDFIINSQDLTNSLAIIADAAFNNLIKSGVKGIVDYVNPKPDSNKNRAYDDRNRTRAREASGEYNAVQNSITEGTRVSYLNQLNSASGNLLKASTTLATASSTNQGIITTGESLLACVSNSSTDRVVAQYAIDIASSTTRIAITGKSKEIETLDTTVKGFKIQINSCTDISCLSGLSQENLSGSVTGAESLNTDANNILLSIQGAYNDLQIRKRNNCP